MNWRGKQHHKLLLLACLLFKVAILKERGHKRPNKKKTTECISRKSGWVGLKFNPPPPQTDERLATARLDSQR